MILRNKIRLLALVVAACAVGLIIYTQIKVISLKEVDSKVIECERAQDSGMEIKRCREALETLNKAISYYAEDENVDALLRDRAWVKTLLDDLDGAMADTNNALALDPNSAWAWYWRGRLNMLTGDMESAIANFRQSSKVNPLYCPTNTRIRRMTHVFYKLGTKGPSVLDETIDKLRYADPRNLNLVFAKYLADSPDGPYSAAHHVLDIMIQSTNRPEHLMLQRARIYERTEEYEKALVDLEDIAKDPEFYEHLGGKLRARIKELKAAGNSCAAEEFSLRNVQIPFVYKDALKLKIDVLSHMTNWGSALASADELIAYRPRAHMNWTKRGKILEQLGRVEEAKMSYKEAIRLARPENYDASNGTSPPLIEALFRLAAIYEEEGRSAEAQAIWDESLSIADNSVIWDVQELMKNAGHYIGERTDFYDPETKSAVHACLNDTTCKWESIGGLELR
ncbi:tetratricopeptide repeat protein [Ruegeria lacuscaerulensis]|uniref:tetratricopeptide repeat protein n=1 Tax=Ruegeria lacuscaerulensis TaxID=55218 RepID=UPI00147E5A5D|nr:tetratricopeptide repeat protein [Ruegeria lacuscaerulensis]